MTSSCWTWSTFAWNRPSSRYGIEHTKELHWRDWSCGDEIVKGIMLRNVTTDLIRLEYKLPKDRQFVVEYPKPLKLYPGLPISIQVECGCISKVDVYRFTEAFDFLRFVIRFKSAGHLCSKAMERCYRRTHICNIVRPICSKVACFCIS